MWNRVHLKVCNIDTSSWRNNDKQLGPMMLHDMNHRGQRSHFFQNWAIDTVIKHSIPEFVWSKSHLPTLFSYKVMNICVIYFLMYFFVFYTLFLPVSQFHICRLWPPWSISSHVWCYACTVWLVFVLMKQYQMIRNIAFVWVWMSPLIIAKKMMLKIKSF